MAKWTSLGLILLTLFSYYGCSDVQFDQDENFNKCQGFPVDCERAGGVDHVYDTFRTGSPQVDILVISDNSGSMSIEQAKMAEKFHVFLDVISDLDYRVAVTTTAISERGDKTVCPSQWSHGPMDGCFAEFQPGLKYIDRSTPNGLALFQSTVKRQETVVCEDSNFENCPSGDERAIYAAWEAINRNEVGFFRPRSHLAVIILSDEDERGTGGSHPQLALQEKDQPQTLLDLIDHRFMGEKTVTVHSIIVPPPEVNSQLSAQCLEEQNNQAVESPFRVLGAIGYQYYELSLMTMGLNRVNRSHLSRYVGNICASDYSHQLSAIGGAFLERVSSRKLACVPEEGSLELKLSPKPYPAIDYTIDPEVLEIQFSRFIPENTQVNLQYECAITY